MLPWIVRDWLLKIIISLLAIALPPLHPLLILFSYFSLIEGRDSRFCILKAHQSNLITY